MKDVLSYKDFWGSVHYSAEDEIFFGKIEGIDDLVSFEGTSVAKLKKAFEEAVADYINLCGEAGKDVEKSYKGSLSIRFPSNLHRKAKRLAAMKGLSLSQFIQKAVEDELTKESSL